MIKLILMIVVLFSAIATAKNLKYKRNDFGNMRIHLRCYHIAVKAELGLNHTDRHILEASHYSELVWHPLSKEINNSYNTSTEYFDYTYSYQEGWVDGYFIGLLDDSKDEVNDFYRSACKEDSLMFITTGK